MVFKKIVLLVTILPCLLLAQQNGANRVETFLSRLLQDYKRDMVPVADPKFANFSRYVESWAKEAGLTRTQAEAEIKQWVNAQDNQPSLRRKGLASFYKKDFRAATENFNQSVIKKSNDSKNYLDAEGKLTAEGKNLVKSGVQDLLLLGHVLHVNMDFVKAAQAYQQALPYISKIEEPELWGATVLNIGQSFADLGVRSKPSPEEKVLKSAEDAARKAVEIFQREKYPAKWAEARALLGESRIYLGLRSSTAEEAQKHLQDGITDLQSALQIVTREKRPNYWSKIQNSLGLALSELGFKKSGEESNRLILDSITAYRNALEVRTYKSAAAEWAQTQNSLATTFYFLKDWPKVAECNSNVLKVFPDSETAYRDASELYQKVLFDFDKAFKLNKQWVDRHPNDLFEKIKLVEKYLTTARFPECQEQINMYKQSQDYSALVYSVLDVLDVSNQLALNKTARIPTILDELIARLRLQPDAFKIGFNMAGIKTFVSQNEKMAPHRAWLGQFYTAVEQPKRDAIINLMEKVKANFSAGSN